MIILFTILLFNIYLYGTEIGCKTNKIKDECIRDNPLMDNVDSILDSKYLSTKKDRLKKVKITKDLKSITVTFQKKEFLIERIDNRECPPYCISPIKIDNIKTMGELETIRFIKSLKKNRNRLVIDARSSIEYRHNTLPTAVNIPYNMLTPNSKYREEILKLLGVKKLKKGWYFKYVYKLLIFDNGILDSRATKMIDSLIKIGYPENKILYYRGGINSWKELGLTLF